MLPPPQDEAERLEAALKAAVAERAKLRAAADAAKAHAAERDRVAQERALLNAVAKQQSDLIARQASPSREMRVMTSPRRCARRDPLFFAVR